MDVDELYGLALTRFVPERNALVKQLRADGEREQAAAVAALRKPSAPAGAVNRLVREDPPALDALWAAGDTLSRAQADVLAGSADGRDLAAAAEGLREIVASLVAAANQLIAQQDGAALATGVQERISETLQAAALDGDARAAVLAGRLEHELRHVGLWTGGGATAAPTRAKPRSGKGRAGRNESTRQAAERRERAAESKHAHEAEADARRRAQHAADAADAAERDRDRAAEALAAAEDALGAARTEAQDAEREHRDARSALDDYGDG